MRCWRSSHSWFEVSHCLWYRGFLLRLGGSLMGSRSRLRRFSLGFGHRIRFWSSIILDAHVAENVWFRTKWAIITDIIQPDLILSAPWPVNAQAKCVRAVCGLPGWTLWATTVIINNTIAIPAPGRRGRAVRETVSLLDVGLGTRWAELAISPWIDDFVIGASWHHINHTIGSGRVRPRAEFAFIAPVALVAQSVIGKYLIPVARARSSISIGWTTSGWWVDRVVILGSNNLHVWDGAQKKV